MNGTIDKFDSGIHWERSVDGRVENNSELFSSNIGLVNEDAGISLGSSRVTFTTRFASIIITYIATIPRRKPLLEIGSNRTPHHELSTRSKAKIYDRALAERSRSQFADVEHVKISSTYRIIQRISQRQSLNNKPRSPRPRKHDARDDRSVLHHARKHPECTYADIESATRLNLSRDTFRSILAANTTTN
jgi:hypothetical protein